MRSEQVLIPLIRSLQRRPKLAEATFRFNKWGNALGPGVAASPFEVWELMRSEGPVAWNNLYQSWFITGYDEANELLASPLSRVSYQSDMLLDVRPYSKLGERSQMLLRNFLLLQDPPTHTRLRKVVNAAFSPRQVAAFSNQAGARCGGLLDAIGDEPEPDLHATFTRPLAVQAISTFMGIPRERWKWVSEKATVLAQMLNVFGDFDPVEMDRHVDELFDYFPALATTMITAGSDDLIADLARSRGRHHALSADEFVALVSVILFAGIEPTSSMCGNAIVALANHPEQRTMVRSNPELWPNAVEELLRFDTSVIADPRATTEDIKLGGRTIKAGQVCTIMLGACNRDPRRYDRPNELVLDRQDPRPLSFGHGLHHCLGANMARLELRAGLQAIVERFGDYTIDTDRVEWRYNVAERGPSYLPVRRG